MAVEAANLLEKYSSAAGDDPTAAAQLRQSIVQFKPEWDRYDATRSWASALKGLEVDAPAQQTKDTIGGNVPVMQCLMDVVTTQDERLTQWILTLLYDMLREDSSCFSLFEDVLRQQGSVSQPLRSLLSRQKLDAYTADKAAWLLSAIIGQAPGCFSQQEVEGLLKQLLEPKEPLCTELGVLEAITNLLKSDTFRGLVWGAPGVSDSILKVHGKTNSPLQYRCVFAIWMLSFDPAIMDDLKNRGVIAKFKEILAITRTEKVVRLCLTVLRNFLSHKGLCEDIVEEAVLDAVQNLEFEKWRDAELYDDIRDMATQISSEVHAMSNFERYERELQTGALSWGFIHSTKFWAANVLKFEQNDFRALKMLAGLLLQPGTEPTTLAVACHDLGEFVTMHPLGKKKVAELAVKDRIMQLMSSNDQAYREVRREALLCCQKIMLNKWHEMDAAQ
eukprot:CAMPEP_0197882130 /NCGR_PEP_ID=MMETSP1439-20131203/9380_1 /TAXON_ID=66791 /ORGANISM="Gonyaulax spinifera, Strain CCMP409" /LENGTH=446 /DNA_ID=CAMNT_0043501773 /DNA_START=63 /DNA_END=1403 /DNA_ORIENTATION=+